MSDSDVTLLSEYQIREHGIVIDSVSKRHKSVNGTFGTQRMILSEYIHVPFVDRGGLLGCEILPWTEGDEDIYDVFEITRDLPWKPRQFRDDEEDPVITSTNVATIDSEPAPGVYDYIIPEPTDELYFFDPEDVERTTIGHAATMSLETDRLANSPADDLLAYLSYRELTGYDPYDGYYDGYPAVDEPTTPVATTIPENLSVLDLGGASSTVALMPSNPGIGSSTRTTCIQSNYSPTSHGPHCE